MEHRLREHNLSDLLFISLPTGFKAPTGAARGDIGGQQESLLQCSQMLQTPGLLFPFYFILFWSNQAGDTMSPELSILASDTSPSARNLSWRHIPSIWHDCT